MHNLARWLVSHQQSCTVIDSQSQLPLEIHVKQPERTGRDRLLNALGVPTKPAIIISAGTAITVDAVDAEGRFLGGAIFPGLRLMARALNDHTAVLPLIDPTVTPPPLPGKSTEEAMHTGIVQAAAGGIAGCINQMLPQMQQDACGLFLTGGDAECLKPWIPGAVVIIPHLTLYGLIVVSRISGS
jgi:type III pantothenate kinase